MSLLIGFLRDALLETVMLQDIHIAIREDAVSGSWIGSGTEENPYGGKAAEAGWFDTIMREKVDPGQTVRLLPGTYLTKGYNAAYASNVGWRPTSGTRIIGTSQTNTILKLASDLTSGVTAVVGLDPHSQAHFLEDGFELENLQIDCALPVSGTFTSSGISVNGKNICIHDVLVVNFEARGSDKSHGILLAAAYREESGTPYTLAPENCVVERCRVESGTLSAVTGIRLVSDSNGYYHKYCVVRECYISLMPYSDSQVGIAISGGSGTIIELNRVVSCGYGIGFAKTGSNAIGSRDIIIRHNYLGSVLKGMKFELAGHDVVRLMILNNVIDWPDTSTDPVEAITITASGGASVFIHQLIIRDNIAKRLNGMFVTGSKGITLGSFYLEAVVENNILDVADPADGLSHSVGNNGFRITVFNNMRSDGKRLIGFDTVSGRSDPELATEIEALWGQVPSNLNI